MVSLLRTQLLLPRMIMSNPILPCSACFAAAPDTFQIVKKRISGSLEGSLEGRISRIGLPSGAARIDFFRRCQFNEHICIAGCFHDLHESRRLSGRSPHSSRASRRRQKQAHLVRAVAEAVESRPSTALQAENVWVEKTLQALDRQRTPSRWEGFMA